jgi:general L-amino acid transport system substrate-binding protein
MHRRPAAALWAALPLLLSLNGALADTLETVKSRGEVRCGVNGEVPGLSYRDAQGAWSGLDADFCRAVAAAALGDAGKVAFVPVGTEERLAVLREGKIDLLARNTTWNGQRDLTEGVSFVGVLYYDGQGFMVPRDSGLRSTLELDGARICAVAGTTGPDNAKRYFTRHRMTMETTLYPSLTAARDAYLNGDCSTLTTDKSQLHSLRLNLDDPAAQRILPEVISKEPLAPAVRKGDSGWTDLVRWTLFTLINAEELGIDSGNADMAKAQAESAQVRALLDLDGETAEALGIAPGWGHRVIRQVGNYGELYERNLGKASGLDIKRGLNALWTEGGLLYAPPAR